MLGSDASGVISSSWTNYEALTPDNRIDLFNPVRFPKANIEMCAALLARLRERSHRYPGLTADRGQCSSHRSQILLAVEAVRNLAATYDVENLLQVRRTRCRKMRSLSANDPTGASPVFTSVLARRIRSPTRSVDNPFHTSATVCPRRARPAIPDVSRTSTAALIAFARLVCSSLEHRFDEIGGSGRRHLLWARTAQQHVDGHGKLRDRRLVG